MRKSVLAFGETLWDLLPTGPVLGGAPFNFAYRVNCLGDEGLIVSRLGSDDLGDKALAQVTALGVDSRHLQRDSAHPTGTVKITFDANQVPDYVIIPQVAYDYIQVTEDLLAAAARADCFCFGTLVQRSEVSRRTVQRLLDSCGRNTVRLLDINLRKNCFTVDTITDSLSRADIVKLNEDEAHHLAEMLQIPGNSIPSLCKHLLERMSLTHIVVTLGERGSLVTSHDQQLYTPGYPIQLADPCGAGDAFTAGFVYRHLRGQSLRECADLGNAMGAIVASQRGATSPLSWESVQSFMKQASARVWDETYRQFA